VLQVTSFPFSIVGPGQTAVGQVGFTSPANASYTANITTRTRSSKLSKSLRPTLEYVDSGGSGDGVRPPYHRPTEVLVDEPIGSFNGVVLLSVMRRPSELPQPL
jgi:hypothetical protein